MRKVFILSLSLGSFALAAQAQNAKKVTKGNTNMHPTFIEFDASNAPAFEAGKIVVMDEQNRSSVITDVRLNNVEATTNGEKHYRYQQTFANIPVEGADYIVHTANGKVLSENGKLINQFPAQLTTRPALNESAALNAALNFVGASQYKWQMPGEEQILKEQMRDQAATYFPKGQLVFFSGLSEVDPSTMRLAYKFDVYANMPLSRQIIYVDAENGKVLGTIERLHHTNATGSAVTAYSGTQTITTDQTSATNFRLRETGRGNGITTLNMKNAGTNYAAAVDFTDADNNWNNVNANKDQYATDAHWGTEKTYDYYSIKHGRNSVDNAGLALLSYVHTNLVAFGYGNNVNAFWDGSRMTYGDGNATYSPLTALDIAGHEITHGVTERSSNLVYASESGAMNEGMSDIFGTAVEFYAKGANANWNIGENIGAAFRSMSNPNQFSQPDTYGGTYWVNVVGCSPSSANDQCGVHTNSGVLNFWFYLLSVGGSGTNDKGTAYNVTGITIDKAAAIAYRLNTVYLVSTSKYADARTGSIKAAEDLYGVGSVEATQTANAWTAVGVGGTVTPPACTDNFEPNETLTAAKTISVNTAVSGKISSSTDKDYFQFTTTAAAPKVKITLTNLPADYDLRLYNSAGTQLGISQAGGTTSETIIYNTSTVAATYKLQVYGYSGANSTTCYALTASISGTNFFGISGNDNNGIVGTKNEANTTDFTVFPNPVRGNINVQFSEESASTKQIIITDMSGKAVYSTFVNAVKGGNAVRLSVPKLATGVYILRLDETRFTKLFVE